MERRELFKHAGEISAVPEPEPAHLDDHGSDDEREATELRDGAHQASRRTAEPGDDRWYHLQKWWRENVRLSVPSADCRDHYANERTFLGYLRTSVALSMLGVIVAQLWRLQHSVSPDPVFGYYALSKPLSAILHCSALGMVLLGSVRFWRQQAAMARGKVHACGWEVLVIMGFMGLLMITLFALHIGLDVSKS